MQEQTHNQDEVHYYDESVQVLVIDYYPDQKDWDVKDAEVGEVPDAVYYGRQMQRVLQFKVAVGEIQFVEE